MRSDALDERYGRTPARAHRDKQLLWIGGVLLAAVLAAWVVWAGFDGTVSNFEAKDTGHRISDEYTATVFFQLSVPPGTETTCALQAQNALHAIVGWKVVEIPASTSYTRQFSEDIRTTEMAVTGLIYRCWLA